MSKELPKSMVYYKNVDLALDWLHSLKPKERAKVFLHIQIDYCIICGKNIINKDCSCEMNEDYWKIMRSAKNKICHVKVK